MSDEDVLDTRPHRRASAIRTRLQADHSSVIEAIAVAGRVTADSWCGESTRERAAVVEPFERALRDAGVLAATPQLLATAVDAAGGVLDADPVPAPPYVAITSTGVLLRATTDIGRVVVAIEPFAVARDPTRYVHRDVDARALVSITVAE